MHAPANICSKPGRFLPKVRESPMKHPTLSQSKPRIYYQNGTGRDSYIYADNGGNTISGQVHNRDSRMIFVKNLRTYEPDGDYLNRHRRRNIHTSSSALGHLLREGSQSSLKRDDDSLAEPSEIYSSFQSRKGSTLQAKLVEKLKRRNALERQRDNGLFASTTDLEEQPVTFDHSLNRLTMSQTKDRFHPNSLTRMSASKEEPPTIPTYNAKQMHRDQMATYLIRLDKRLS